MIDNNVVRKIVFEVTDFTGLVVNKDFILSDITIKNIEHCSQSRGIEEQFIIVNFYIIWKHNNHDSEYKKPYTINISMLEYLQYMREEKLIELSITPEDKIRKSLSEYLEFNSDELFRSKFNIVRIFGGAIRDIIADQPIHDVDILCGAKAIRYIEMILEQNGYQYMEMLNGKDLQEMYSEIHIINEPHTWIKGKKIVQLIRPSLGLNISDESIYRQGFNDLISNVDISSCGVSYDGEKLHEDYPNAIVHCQSKVFSVNKSAKMYSGKRVSYRIHKLIDRGWKQIENTITNNRDLKINKLINI